MIVLPLLFIASFLFAQKSDSTSNANTVDNDTTVYTKVDTEASFPGGQQGWIKFLQHNLNAGVAADDGAKVGNYIIWVKFIVTKEGHVKNIVAETKNGFGTEEEVKRVILSGPDWKPAKLNGKPVNSYKRVSQGFDITEG